MATSPWGSAADTNSNSAIVRVSYCRCYPKISCLGVECSWFVSSLIGIWIFVLPASSQFGCHDPRQIQNCHHILQF